VTALSVTQFGGYDNTGFPPHSGDVVIWDATDPTITISFDSPLQSFGIWYTTYDPLTLDAFDSDGNLLDSVTGAPNTDGTTGTSSFLSLADAGIEGVTLTSTPGFFVLDDLTYETGTSAVPEPKSIHLLLAIALTYLCFRSKRYGGPGVCLRRRAWWSQIFEGHSYFGLPDKSPRVKPQRSRSRHDVVLPYLVAPGGAIATPPPRGVPPQQNASVTIPTGTTFS